MPVKEAIDTLRGLWYFIWCTFPCEHLIDYFEVGIILYYFMLVGILNSKDFLFIY